jgi:hypothetical protein
MSELFVQVMRIQKAELLEYLLNAVLKNDFDGAKSLAANIQGIEKTIEEEMRAEKSRTIN